MNSVGVGDRRVPALGQGTWRLGEVASRRREETRAIREGVALGMTVIDTAEMYGEGATESFLGDALAGLRNEIFLVSKVYPQNAAPGRLTRACEASLRRLRTDRLDLYLLHWRGGTPLAEIVEGMEALKASGKIAAWGVSNFDVADMQDLTDAGGVDCVANQILYSLTRRGPEFDLLPDLRRRGVAAMAYSPINQGRLPPSPRLTEIAARRSVTLFQLVLAWVLQRPGLIAIPKAGHIDHVRANAAAASVALTEADMADLDAAFPPPRRKTALQML